MRKRLISPVKQESTFPVDEWFDLEMLSEVEITSENAAYPIESALLPGATSGWRASGPGTQTIRLLFSRPQNIKRIWIQFNETNTERTQEFTLRWSPVVDQSYREIVRQQWIFSSPNALSEVEDFVVNITAALILELTIVPDINGGNSIASLSQLRIA